MARYSTFKYGTDVLYGADAAAGDQQWSLLDGGDHGGEDWVVDDATIIAAGVHTNVRRFLITASGEVRVAPHDGTLYGRLRVEAMSIDVRGSLIGSNAGYAGGSGGGGGGGGSLVAGRQGAGGDPGLVTGGADAGLAGAPGSGATGGAGGVGGDGDGGFGGSGGSGGTANSAGASGVDGGYLTGAGQGDASTDDSVVIGSGGGGSGAGGGRSASAPGVTHGGGGGGGSSGGRGGAVIELVARGRLQISGVVVAQGSLGVVGRNGGAASPSLAGSGGRGGAETEENLTYTGAGGTSYPTAGTLGGAGGPPSAGAGGGVLLRCSGPFGVRIEPGAQVGNYGGDYTATNGGTVKLRGRVGGVQQFGTVLTGRLHTTETALVAS